MMTLRTSLNQHGGIIFSITVEWDSIEKLERVMEIEPTYGAVMALDRLIGIKRTSYAKISFTTLPWTSVRRKSRPA